MPFSVAVPPAGAPTISSSSSFTRNDSAALCGGLTLDMRVGRLDADTLRITLPIHNATEHDWQGSVKLDLGGTAVPVRIGRVPAGETREQTIRFNVDKGAHEINGALLIGP